jgi:CMP-N,N'-diacetyllegionaminic acid synthase
LEFLGIVPARKNSKRIQNKNFKNIAGKPLIDWTLEAATNSEVFRDIVVSTDSETELIRLSKFGILEIGVRPKYLSLDSTPTLDVINYSLQLAEKMTNKHYDAVITLQPTSPLRTAQDIQDSVSLFNRNLQADSLVSTTSISHIYYPRKLFKNENKFVDMKNSFQSYKDDVYFAANGAAIYISKRELLPQYLLGSNCLSFEMPRWKSVDIDTPEDFILAEITLNNFHLFFDSDQC